MDVKRMFMYKLATSGLGSLASREVNSGPQDAQRMPNMRLSTQKVR